MQATVQSDARLDMVAGYMFLVSTSYNRTTAAHWRQYTVHSYALTLDSTMQSALMLPWHVRVVMYAFARALDAGRRGISLRKALTRAPTNKVNQTHEAL